MNYTQARNFTDAAHKLAIKTVYNKLKWSEHYVENLDYYDKNHGIDYVFSNGVTVQERFRKYKYKQYSDITFRYKNAGYDNSYRKPSEFFKIKADIFVYGVLTESEQKFCKFSMIDMKYIYQLTDDGKIIPTHDKRQTSYIQNGIMYCPIKMNVDDSSSFIVMDIRQLNQLTDNKISIINYGF